MPCLTTLVSSYGNFHQSATLLEVSGSLSDMMTMSNLFSGSYDQKGKLMGIYRSLGALARSLGPVTASIGNIYFNCILHLKII